MYKKSKDINIIFDQFQQWMDNVLRKECGRQDYRTFHYSLEEFSGFVPYFLGQDIGVGVGSLPTEKGGDVTMPYVPFPIQQIRQEIEAFVEVLLSQNVRSVLEIGLGQFGGTHMLFS